MSSSPLASFSTCEISDALIKLAVPHGGHIPDIHCFSDPVAKLCATAYTVQIVLASDHSAPYFFLDTAPPGSVIVIDVPSAAKNAVWGGLMSAGAHARSAAGAIISGRCRDLAELRALQFPVFARGHSTLGQTPYTRASAIQVPLVIRPWPQGGLVEDAFPPVEVRPGDWIIADEDGVVCVPHDLELKVVEMATKGRKVDDLCMEDIKAGRRIKTVFEQHRGS